MLRSFINWTLDRKSKICTLKDIENCFDDFFANLVTCNLKREMFIDKIELKANYAKNCQRKLFLDFLNDHDPCTSYTNAKVSVALCISSLGN